MPGAVAASPLAATGVGLARFGAGCSASCWSIGAVQAGAGAGAGSGAASPSGGAGSPGACANPAFGLRVPEGRRSVAEWSFHVFWCGANFFQ